MKALIFKQFGGPDVLQYADIPAPTTKDNEILIRMKAIGVNFADVYRRKGNYHLAGEPPFILGYEGAGIVEQVGSQVTGIKPGDRIAFADVPFANAEFVTVPLDKAIPIPNEISFDIAASLLLQGLTAHYLTQDSTSVAAGDVVLVHAAAGGVGQLLVQIAKILGATVIGLTSSAEKATISRSIGADHVFLYSDPWQESVKAVTNGSGADIVYDSVGTTLADSFSVTRTCGTVVFYGMSGGDPAPVDPRMLMDTSKTLTGGDLWNVLTSAEERRARSAQLFNWVLDGQLRVSTPTRYQLADGAKAHEHLESRKSSGKIILIP